MIFRILRPSLPALTRKLTLSVLAIVLGLSVSEAKAQAISQKATLQISALMADKETRTPAQRKLDSNLLYAARMNRGEPVAAGIQALETGVAVDPRGSTVVDIKAHVDDPLLERTRELGGEVLSYFREFQSIRARMPLAILETLAADPRVIFIAPKQEAVTNRPQAFAGRPRSFAGPSASRVSPGSRGRTANLTIQLLKALDVRSSPRLPDVINASEGVVTHRADLARSTFGATGAGVKVGVLSDGVDSLADLEVSGDLPVVTVLPGQAGSGDEGTAMLEIVHDVAPGAQLYFATGSGGLASFASNILALRAAGCDIIVDDVTYFVESPFQKGQAPSVVSTSDGALVTQAVNDVTATGALYFSSSANSGNKTNGTSGTWEGDFADGGPAGGALAGAGNLHNFGGTLYDTLTGGSAHLTLFWSDPLGGAGNDYDLFLLDATGTFILGSSLNVQDGTQDPLEAINATGSFPVGSRLVVVRYSGAARFLHLDAYRGRLAISTAGSTRGHNAPPGPNALGVAATPSGPAVHGPPPEPTGPYPGSFDGSDVVEFFSSDGPRIYFYNADSSPITPGNVSSTGGEVVQQPMITAADGVSCAAPGFNPFFGTSAAAPHAAAIAALVKSMNSSLTATQVSTYLTGTAIDIMSSGVDRDSGHGILEAYAAVAAVGAPAQATLLFESATATETSGNGDGHVEPGECVSLSVQLRNGNATIGASAISATLSSSTPGVTIDGASASWADIPGGTVGTSLTPFTFRLSTSASCPLVITLTLTVSYSGGTSPQVLTFVVPTGTPPVTVGTILDTSAPPAGPAYSAATGTQTGRLNRYVPASACGVAELNPGLYSDSGAYRYDAYTFVNCAAGPACINVRVDFPAYGGSVQLFTAAYANSFNPNDPSANWLGDAGSSSTSMSFSVNVNAGQTFVVVVHEVTPGAAPSYAYSLNVDGACLPCPTTTYSCCPTGPLTVAAPSIVVAGSPGWIASVPDHTGSTYAWTVTNGTITAGQGTCQVTFTAGASGSVNVSVVETSSSGCQQSGSVSTSIVPAGSAVKFHTLTPCRVLDTRSNSPVAALGTLTVTLTGAPCGIPSGAKSVSVNLTVTEQTAPGFLTIYPADVIQPEISNINFGAGRTRANNAFLGLSGDGNGRVNVFNGSAGTVHVILDVNGYFQ